jgi:ABC-type branched-subunit amino acid transport system ATPase component
MVDEVEKIVKNIKNTDVPVLMVEGNIEMIMGLADLVYLFNHGKTMFSGSVADIRNDPDLSETYIGL